MTETPSESAITLSSHSVSTEASSIPNDAQASKLRKNKKKWFNWKVNWFKKNSKKYLDEEGEGSIFAPSSRNGSFSSRADKSPDRPAQTQVEQQEETISDTSARLKALRDLMIADKINFYIVPNQDAHISEFVAPKDQRLKWISGFTGSSGVAVISEDEATLFTDSRYWIQASRQLDSNWKLQRVSLDGDQNDWLDYIQRCSKDSRIAIDPRHVSHRIAVDLRERLRACNSKLIFPEHNMIDAIWRGRPYRSKEMIFIHPLQFTGVSASDKLNLVKDWIRNYSSNFGQLKEEEKPAATLLTSLAEIAWTLNLRGNDIPFNPLFYSFLLITLHGTTLFMEKAKLTDDISQYLTDLDVKTEEYDDIWNFLRHKKWGDGKVLISQNSPYVVSLLISSSRYIIAPSIVEDLKAIKNEVELRGLEQAYVRDGAVYVRWLAWLEEKIRKGSTLTEYEATVRLSKFQNQGQNFVGLAYKIRSAYGSNAAMPFYSPPLSDSSIIERKKPYLMHVIHFPPPPGYDGTCSTARTTHFGQPTNEQRDAFTRTLQGHIAIDTAIFPEGTTGGQLDVLAKRELWAGGLNYLVRPIHYGQLSILKIKRSRHIKHATGYGIGSFLSVHEGPQEIAVGNNTPLKPGHVIINQPGYYREDDFGIRIGSALVVARVQIPNPSGGSGTWLGFRRLTRVPIQTRMIQPGLLSEKEKNWIKDHNLNCFKVLAPLLKDDKQALIWLRGQLDPGLTRELGL
ncbi:hypothetical protein Clacol_003568 [Clathrus columnatus]|uniref:Uncharacterized protein n=1 Tax=Clathrus columnatus TaxID=1419009 RepID=A0AAV5A3W7_9AGAM|nr:hypothetical protein Clacol_003568 [Clathrus columnatus]